MAETLNCSPCYDGRPDYDPSGGTAILPQETLARSRLFAGGTFFRSKLDPDDSQSLDCNNISLEVENTDVDEMTLIVYFNDIEVERYVVFQDDGCVFNPAPPPPSVGINVAIPALRTATASSSYISMPDRGTDEQDPDILMLPPTDDPCLSTFAKTAMSGGSGPSTTDSGLAAIRTGPERTIIFISEKENANGTPYEPSAGSNLIQWNYDTEQWVSYVIDADCALPDDRCP